MPDNNYLVIRIHPDSPVDGATFSTYLNGLQIQVFLAGTTKTDPSTGAITGILLGETHINAQASACRNSVDGRHLCRFRVEAPDNPAHAEWIR